MPVANEVPPPRDSVIDGPQDAGVIEGRGPDDQRTGSEGDNADLDRRGLFVDEVAGGQLRRSDAAGLDVFGSHAVGDVHGKDHGGLEPRRRDGRHRSGGRHGQKGERNCEQSQTVGSGAIPVADRRS